MHISGAHYLGSRFDFSFSESFVSIRVTGQDGLWVPPLEVQLWPSQAQFPLPPGRQVLPAQSRVQYVETPPPMNPWDRHSGHLFLQDTRSPFLALLAGYRGHFLGRLHSRWPPEDQKAASSLQSPVGPHTEWPGSAMGPSRTPEHLC